MGKHLVLVGGGHAHLSMLKNLRQCIEKGHRVTLISASAYHYYSGMGPGLLSGIYRPEEVRFNIKRMAEDRGAAFIEDAVVRINAPERTLALASGRTVPYDVASFNTGSDVPAELPGSAGPNVFPVKPIINLLKARQFIIENLKTRSVNIVVIGGGPAGLEMAANAWRLAKDLRAKAGITMVAGARLMARFPEEVRTFALRSLTERAVAVIEGAHARAVEQGMVALEDGRTLPADVVLLAPGIRPSPLFRDSGLTTGADGGLLVNRYLQSTAHPEIFGGGDCISLEGHQLGKVGVYAVRQNPILKKNLCAALDNGPMAPFVPQKKYLLIFNLGDGTAILNRGGFTADGRLAFRLKDYIDRGFMRKFQVSDERKEA